VSIVSIYPGLSTSQSFNPSIPSSSPSFIKSLAAAPVLAGPFPIDALGGSDGTPSPAPSYADAGLLEDTVRLPDGVLVSTPCAVDLLEGGANGTFAAAEDVLVVDERDKVAGVEAGELGPVSDMGFLGMGGAGFRAGIADSGPFVDGMVGNKNVDVRESARDLVGSSAAMGFLLGSWVTEVCERRGWSGGGKPRAGVSFTG